LAEQKPLRIGVLGLTHDHVWGNLADLAASPRGVLVGAAEPHPDLRARIRSAYPGLSGELPVFETARALLDEVPMDGVYVYADNARAVDLVVLAAEYGLPAMVEKPMAATLAGADRMLAAARRAGVSLMINWPFAWRKGLRKALAMARAGEIGEVFSLKYRAAHEGPKEYGCSPHFYEWLYDAEKNGGGALIDYCAYGVLLGRYLLGLPSRVTGVAGRLRKEYVTVEDNAVILMEWPRAIGTAEGSWSQVGLMTAYETAIYGSEGTLCVERGDQGRVFLATREAMAGEEVPAPDLPEEEQNATAYFLSRLAEGKPVEGLCDPRVGRDAQEILEAGLISARHGASVSLPLSVV
jgi:predicted dehydrogenase